MKRRLLISALLPISWGIHLFAVAAAPAIEVYKSASCGCCADWIRHMEANGFVVKANNVANPTDYREKFGMPQELGSCHTAMVQDYAIEGHVPAADIKRLLQERPKTKGLAVPSMPLGSPGMEGPRSDPYDVFLVHADRRYSPYRHYATK
jgi:hypothetical protein